MRFFAFSLCLLSSPLVAAWGPQDLLDRARQRSESLAQASLAQDLVQARRRESLGEWLPQATLKLGEGFVQGSQTQWQDPSLRLNVREDLLKGLDQPAAFQAASAAYAQAQAQLQLSEQALARELGDAYFDAARLDEELVSEAQVLKAAQDSVAELKRRVSLGRSRRAELSSAQAQVARIQALIADLQGQRDQAWEALASLCGLSEGEGLMAVEGLPAAPSAWDEKGLDALPLVRAAAAALDLAKAGRVAQEGGFLPTLYAEGNWNFARQGGAGGPDWDAQLGLDLPVFQAGAQWARLKQAKLQVQSAQLGLEKARREARREAVQAQSGLSQALAKAEAARLSQEAAEKGYADQRRDFNDSLVSSLDLLNAFQAVENARLDALRARYDAHQALLRHRLATGQAPF